MWGRGTPASWANQSGVPGCTERKVTEAKPRDAERAERPTVTQSRGSSQLPRPRFPPCPGGSSSPQPHSRVPHGSQLCPRRSRRKRSRLNAGGAPGAPEPNPFCAATLRPPRPLRPHAPHPGPCRLHPPLPRGLAPDLPPPASQRSSRSSGPGALPPWSEGSLAEEGLRSPPRWTRSWSPSLPTDCSRDPASWT